MRDLAENFAARRRLEYASPLLQQHRLRHRCPTHYVKHDRVMPAYGADQVGRLQAKAGAEVSPGGRVGFCLDLLGGL